MANGNGKAVNSDFVAVLKQNPNGVLATRDGEKVRTRVFQYLFTEGKRVFFCTSSEKPVYAQIKARPWVSFCTYPPNFTPVLTLNGKAVFVEDRAVKVRVLEENPLIKSVYQSPDNPLFKIFYIDVEEVETFSIADGLNHYRL